MNITQQLADALRAMMDAPGQCDCGIQGCMREQCLEDLREEARTLAHDALAEYDAQQAAAPAGDHKDLTPWHAKQEDAHHWCVYDKDGYLVSRRLRAERAARIVACVNACKGIDTALLESGSRDDVAAELLALHNFGDKA